MKEKKIKMNGYDASLYKCDRYTTLLASFMFELEYTKENIYLLDLLGEYLIFTNEKYKTKKEIHKNIMRLYDIDIKIDNFNIGKQLFVEVAFGFLDPKLVKDDYLADAINFAHDMLFLPNFKDGKCDKQVLDEIRTRMINAKVTRLSHPDTKCNHRFLKSFADGSYITRDLIDTKEEYENLINSFKDEDIIKMHDYLLKECFVGATFMGNYEDEHIELFKKLFPFKKRELNADYDEILKFNIDNKDITVSDEDIKESTLLEVFSIDNFSGKDAYIYSAIVQALGGVGMMMHKTLRDELGLVYSAKPGYNKRSGFITLRAYIDKDNKDATLDAFDKVLEKFSDDELVDNLLQKGKKELKLQNYVEDESMGRVFSRLISEKYKWVENLDVITDKYMSITRKEVQDAVKRLKKELVFFYRGDK